jgi:hypothetical protein
VSSWNYEQHQPNLGVIVRQATGRSQGDWMVRWENDPHGPRMLPAYEVNLERAD